MESRRRSSRLSLAFPLVLLSVFAASTLGGSTAARGADGPELATLLVQFQQGASPAQRENALADAHGAAAGSIPELRVQKIHVAQGDLAAALSRLQASPSVAFAEADGLLYAAAVPNDPMWPSEASQVRVRAPEAWDSTTGSSSVVIAVLDTGIDPATPDLQGALVPGWDFVNNDADPRDDHGHGTLVAGAAAARGNNGIGMAGYCWTCSLMPVKVMGADGAGLMSTVASGITWAADHGARVINLSLTGGAYSTLASAVQYAQSKGAVVVAAAGNSGSASATYPAAYPGVVGVSGSNPDDTLNTSSNYGSWVRVAAPWCNYGTSMRQSDGSYRYASFCGTSSATPAVAGILGLAFALNPSASNTQVVSALERGTVPVAGSRQVTTGRVDALLALNGPSAPTGTLPASSEPPSVSGTALAGAQLVASPGTWTGSAPMAYGYQWKRCSAAGGSCSDIAGASSGSYMPGAADVGFAIRLAVTASNPYGSTVASSAPTAAIAPASAPPSTGSSTATFTGSLNRKQSSRSFDLAVGGGSLSASLAFTKAQSLQVRLVDGSGVTLASAAGPSALQLSASVAPGSYRLIVEGTSGSFTLNVGYPSP